MKRVLRRSGVVVVLAGLLGLTAYARGQDWNTESEETRAAQTGGALAGGVLVGAAAVVAGAYVGSLIQPGLIDDTPIPGGLIPGLLAGAGLGYPVGCGLGTAITGAAQHAGGSSCAGYGGAFAGMAIGAIVAWASGSAEIGLITMGVLSPAGAVIGYNAAGGSEDTSTPLGLRLCPPAVALRTHPGHDHMTNTALDCRLLTVRF